jgi:hypothetical protein
VHPFAARLAAVQVGFLLLPIQIEETDRRRLIDFDAMVRGNASQGVIDMRQMIDGYIADEGAFDGGIAQTPVQPTQENTELREQRKDNDHPIWVHECDPQTYLLSLPAIRGDLSNRSKVAIRRPRLKKPPAMC